MANLESEIKDLKEKNNDLVQKVQYWKMTAAQRENEKLSLMKEINELRLKLSKLRSTGGLQAQNLDTAIQAASEKALAHLVRASGEIAHTIDLAKAYMRDRQELEASSPRWSVISGTPSTDKVERIHRVPPTIMGGQSIQPVVALSRTLLNTSNPRLTSRSPNQNRNVSERAVPMHMLQDVYIPLTRIDADRVLNNMETESRPHSADNSAEDLEDSTERVLDESQNMSEDEDFNATRRLDAVTEDLEPEEEMESPTHRGRPDPLEGPSWLLDGPIDKKRRTTRLPNLEPDSTTGAEGSAPPPEQLRGEKEETVGRLSCVFSPTVRRRKKATPPRARTPPHARTPPRARTPPHARTPPRALSPPHAPTQQLRYSPKPLSARKNSESGSQHSRRGEEEGAGDMSETSLTSGPHTRRSDDSDSDSVVGSRSRRNRKVVTYKEKPLNRKLRR